jgi:NAD(P)-dependent dehydrogenase (short-subunit alcohol dehydrogenase family)
MESNLLNHKVAIVTGGAGGIGRAISLRFAREGFRVAIIGRDEKKGREAVEAIAANKGDAEFFRSDLGCLRETETAVDRILQRFGKVDVLVNNAAVSGYMGAVVETPIQELKDTLEVNLVSIFFLSQLVLPHMMENKFGRIINISSVAYRKTPPNSATYNISKSGLNTLTKTLSKEVASHGVTVNAVAPGLVLTERILNKRVPGIARKTGTTPRQVLDKFEADTDTRRLTGEGEVAELVRFLASDAAANITGVIMDVDGGY